MAHVACKSMPEPVPLQGTQPTSKVVNFENIDLHSGTSDRQKPNREKFEKI